MMLIDLIGGSGFIGTRFVKRLKSSTNFCVKIIDKVPSKFYPDLTSIADIRSIEQLRQCISQNSIIVHLAAEHRDDISELNLYEEVNVNGAKNICKVASEKGVNTIIFTSSVAIYGFAPIGTDESGEVKPFNAYGQTKYKAELVFKTWQAEYPSQRALIIIRPTVVFGERNRGNVFNLLKQIASGRFLMIGDGLNRKSMAYVENVAAFLEHSLAFKPGVHIYNYIDKPDFTMNKLVAHVNKLLGRSSEIKIRLPYWLGLAMGKVFDVIAFLTRKKFAISSIRVKKFCADSVYESALHKTGFTPPVSLMEALEKTIRYEFIEDHKSEQVFYTE